MNTTKNNVQSVTKKSPALKTNARKLATSVWLKELRELGINPKTCNVNEFFSAYNKAELSSAITISRIKVSEQ